MKSEILDVRKLVTILLVLVSLMGQKWSNYQLQRSDAQNLNFMKPEIQLSIVSDISGEKKESW